jgi:hypothetical protein
MFDLKGKHEHAFLSILNKYIYTLIRSSTEHKLFMYLTSSIIIKRHTNTKYIGISSPDVQLTIENQNKEGVITSCR